MSEPTIAQNLEEIRERISRAATRAGRRAEEVRLVAVTKNVLPERVAEAVAAGVDLVGENYLQEAERKKKALLGRPVQWHMIGHLQSNKVRQAVTLFDVIETVDREKIIRALQEHAEQAGKSMGVLIQVNLSGEQSKSGTTPEQVPRLLELISGCENLSCRGLMTLPPWFDQPERVRPFFSGLRSLRDSLLPGCPPHVDLEDLSMGMSGDYEVAIEEGATLVRIGTALFGPR